MDNVISGDGTSIAFKRFGEGPPVIHVVLPEILAPVLEEFFDG